MKRFIFNNINLCITISLDITDMTLREESSKINRINTCKNYRICKKDLIYSTTTGTMSLPVTDNQLILFTRNFSHRIRKYNPLHSKRNHLFTMLHCITHPSSARLHADIRTYLIRRQPICRSSSNGYSCAIHTQLRVERNST